MPYPPITFGYLTPTPTGAGPLTYAVMQQRIADELDRSDLTSEIQTAIQDAIGYHERRYYYFLSQPTFTPFNTVAGQEYYTSTDNPNIPLTPIIYELTGTFYGLRRQLHKRSWQFIDSISTLTTSRAMPQDWAYNGEVIRLYPIPDNTYSISMACSPRLVRPVNASDGGPWLNDAEAMIRTYAKIRLLSDVIRSSDMEGELQLLWQQYRDEHAALTQETATREGTGKLMPSQF